MSKLFSFPLIVLVDSMWGKLSKILICGRLANFLQTKSSLQFHCSHKICDNQNVMGIL